MRQPSHSVKGISRVTAPRSEGRGNWQGQRRPEQPDRLDRHRHHFRRQRPAHQALHAARGRPVLDHRLRHRPLAARPDPPPRLRPAGRGCRHHLRHPAPGRARSAQQRRPLLHRAPAAVPDQRRPHRRRGDDLLRHHCAARGRGAGARQRGAHAHGGRERRRLRHHHARRGRPRDQLEQGRAHPVRLQRRGNAGQGLRLPVHTRGYRRRRAGGRAAPGARGGPRRGRALAPAQGRQLPRLREDRARRHPARAQGARARAGRVRPRGGRAQRRAERRGAEGRILVRDVARAAPSAEHDQH